MSPLSSMPAALSEVQLGRNDVDDFVASYHRRLLRALSSFDRAPLKRVIEVLEGVMARGATLWIAGNGGSAAVADHAACDLSKWTASEGRAPLRCVSLASNLPLLSALGNDFGYAEVFRRQLVSLARPGDALLLVSASGNSENVVRACEHANQHEISTIAFVGFEGGRLRELARHSVWIPSDDYGVVEDAHQSLVHGLAQYIRERHER